MSPLRTLMCLSRLPFACSCGTSSLPRLDRIGDDRLQVELRLDQVRGLLGDLLGLRRHERQRIADVANAFANAHQDRPVIDDQPMVVLAGNVLCRQHCHDARHCPRPGDIQALQEGMRHHGTPHLRIQHARKYQVVRVDRLAVDLLNRIRPDLDPSDDLLPDWDESAICGRRTGSPVRSDSAAARMAPSMAG